MDKDVKSNVQSCPILAQNKKGNLKTKSFRKAIGQFFKEVWHAVNKGSESFLPGAELIVRVIAIGLAAFTLTVFTASISASSNPYLVITLTDITEGAQVGLVLVLSCWFLLFIFKGIDKKLRQHSPCNTFDQLSALYVGAVVLVGFSITVSVFLFRFTPNAITKIECAALYSAIKDSKPEEFKDRKSICADAGVPIHFSAENFLKRLEQRATHRNFMME